MALLFFTWTVDIDKILLKMSKVSVQDLQQTIEAQSKKIAKYETKLRDVVSAYRSLQKEKGVLEEIVKSLNSEEVAGNIEQDEILQDHTDFVDPLNAKGNADTGSTQLKEKLDAMSKAVAAITEEKSKMELAYQADKKKINQEKHELEEQMSILQKKFKDKEKKYEEIDQLKKRLRSQQLEREKEQNDHQIMLRELQDLVSAGRYQKEKLESELEETQLRLVMKESQPDKSKELEIKIANLLDELKTTKGKLKIAEDTAAKPSSMELKLQLEMASAQAEHRMAIIQEQQRSKHEEERFKHSIKVSEERITELEFRIAELGEMVGTYDRQRQQDFSTIQRLKEKNCQLENENTALAKVASCLREKEDSFRLFDSADDNNCQIQLQQLQEEFDNYKLKMQSAIKNKKENESIKEAAILREQVSTLKEKLSNCNYEMEEMENQHRIALSSLRTSLDEMKFNQKQHISAMKVEWQNKLSALEQQMQRQRERSFSLIEEKENEIETLKMQLGIDYRVTSRKSSKSFEHISLDLKNQDPNILDVAIELSKLTSLDKKEAQFLHYAQELARKDVEIANLRRSKHQLEVTMRDIEIKAAAKEESYANRLEMATNEVSRLERNSSREGANLEYLKNVVLSYMLSSGNSSRQHMLNAIATVLKFSEKELECVKQYNSTWWWNQSS